MKRLVLGILMLCFAAGVLCLRRDTASARSQEPEFGEVRIASFAHAFNAILKRKGETIRNGTVTGGVPCLWEKVPVGRYELVLEAKGFDTQVQEINVTTVEPVNFNNIEMKPGDGVLYFGKKPSIDSILKRIADLEAVVEKLSKK